jgi:hypothetical protein
VRNLDQAAFELWEIRLDDGQFSDALAGWILVKDLEGLDRTAAHAVAMKAFGVPLPEDFVPAE